MPDFGSRYLSRLPMIKPRTLVRIATIMSLPLVRALRIFPRPVHVMCATTPPTGCRFCSITVRYPVRPVPLADVMTGRAQEPANPRTTRTQPTYVKLAIIPTLGCPPCCRLIIIKRPPVVTRAIPEPTPPISRQPIR